MTDLPRVVVGMIDGFGWEYFEQTPMPHLRRMADEGFCREAAGVFPSVTNVNNVSICCAAWPEEHGIIGNSYYDPASEGAVYMNSADLIRCPTLFERAARTGRKSALLTSKRKTIELLSPFTEVAIAAECPPQEWIDRLGKPGDIYSCEINYWLWSAANDLLKHRPDISVLYVHTTDYPMHTWAPEEPDSREHLEKIDALLGQATTIAPDATFFLTADHSMNHKTRAIDLTRALAERGTPIRFALSPERDYYIKHHRNLAGCSYLWLKSPDDEPGVRESLAAIDGIEDVLTRDEAVKRFHLPPQKVGELVVLADRDTAIGDLEQAYEELPATYRNHGSLYEMRVPIIIWPKPADLPAADQFSHNKDLTHFLFR